MTARRRASTPNPKKRRSNKSVASLPDRQFEFIERESERLQITRSEVLRRIIDDHMGRLDKKEVANG